MPTGTNGFQTFYAHGKLLLAGEYLVLDGAVGLAAPATLGQRLDVRPAEQPDRLRWRSVGADGAAWLEHTYTRKELKRPPPAVAKAPADRVARLLAEVLSEHPRIWPRGTGLELTATLEFERAWGLGSSATLAYLLATWGAYDPYALNQTEFGGSGYDIATASADGPLRYRLRQGRPRVEPVAWAPAYLDQLYLVHLGHKQDSRASIADYRAKAEGELTRYAAELDAITDELQGAPSLAAFQEAMRRHEALVGYVTHQTPIGKARFADVPGAIKSLGGWGGDFALVASDAGAEAVGAYFARHALATVLPAGELLRTRAAPIAPRPAVARPGRWLAFLYGALAEPRVDNEWLTGHRYWQADLLDHAVELTRAASTPFAQPGRFVPGTLVELTAEELQALDLHPQGTGIRRTQVRVRTAGGEEVLALAWLG